MSPRAFKKNPPVARRRKRALHAFYLAQPFLQFVALMAVLFTLGRCSPLASSTDKGSKMLGASSVGSPHTALAIQSAEDEDIKRELKDLRGADELDVIGQSDFAKLESNSLEADKGADLNGVQGLFRARAAQGVHRNVRLLVLRISKEQREAFFQNGSTRVDLASALAGNMAPDVRRAYFTEVHKLAAASNLTAHAYLVLADEDAAAPDAVNALPVQPKFQLAIFPSDDKAYLQVSRGELALDDQQQKLIESNKDKALSLAIVLE
jgi:hypothetical protein